MYVLSYQLSAETGKPYHHGMGLSQLHGSIVKAAKDVTKVQFTYSAS